MLRIYETGDHRVRGVYALVLSIDFFMSDIVGFMWQLEGTKSSYGEFLTIPFLTVQGWLSKPG